MEFELAGYDTLYTSSGDINVDMDSYACFAKIFDFDNCDDVITNTYSINIYLDLAYAEKYNKSNICFLPVEDIIEYLDYIQDIVEFKYQLTELIDKDTYKYLDITFTLSGTLVKHKFVLTYIRYLYEFPNNIYTYMAYQLKSTFNVNHIWTCIALMFIYRNGEPLHSYISCNNISPLFDNKDIKNFIEDKDNYYVNDLFDELCYEGRDQLRKLIGTSILPRKIASVEDVDNLITRQNLINKIKTIIDYLNK